MMHTIRKQIIDIHTTEASGVYGLQQAANYFYYAAVLPTLEKIFDELSTNDNVLVFDTIEIDIGTLTKKSNGNVAAEENIYKNIRKQLQEKISIAVSNTKEKNSSTTAVKTTAGNAFNQWMYYMEYGVLPWNAKTANVLLLSVLETLATDVQSVSVFANNIRKNRQGLLRIVRLHETAFLVKLIEAITALKQNNLLPMVTKVEKIFKSGEYNYAAEKIWEALLIAATEKNMEYNTEQLIQTACIKIIKTEVVSINKLLPKLKNEPALNHLLLPIIEMRMRKEESSKSTTNKNDNQAQHDSGFKKTKEIDKENILSFFTVTTSQLLEEAVFIKHAGLILLHPFFRFLFKNTQLLKEAVFIDTMAQQQAIYLLHYIATGQLIAEEYELAVPKLICGWPIEEPVSKENELTAIMLSEADDLLKAAIEQWHILKNTSVAGLRETFLQRPGKIYTTNDKLYIQVEKSAVDMLLDHLPWNLSLIKLPWLNDVIRVEWR